MKIKLQQLTILSFFLLIACSTSVSEKSYSFSQILFISAVQNTLSYAELLSYLGCVLLIVPFVYLAYLLNYTTPDRFKMYYFKGDYNAKNIIAYIEQLEAIFYKSFPIFKQSIEQCNQASKGNLRLYSEAIYSNIFCIKMNGRKRLSVFWEFADPFLKGMMVLLPIISVFIVLVTYFYWGVGILVFSLIFQIFLIPLMLVFFFYLLQIFQYVIKKTGKELPALNISLFALETLINRYVKRAFDKKSGEYFYYSTVTEFFSEVNVRSDITGVYHNPNKDIKGVIEDYGIEVK